MEQGLRNVAQRITNAEERFITYAMETANLDRQAAIRALLALRAAKVLKIDAIGGQFSFTHGAYAEPDVLRRASASVSERKIR
jgi:hypothetical protein